MSDDKVYDAIGRLAGQRIFGEPVRGPLLTVRQLRDFINQCEAKWGPHVLDYYVHYLNMEDSDEGKEAENYATMVELDCFATDNGDEDGEPVQVLSILRNCHRRTKT